MAGLLPALAHSREAGVPSQPMENAAPAGMQLAQSGDVEVYYDGLGRRVLIDSYTGEILSIQRPRRNERRAARRETRDRYYLDDPADMERLRRDRMRQLRPAPRRRKILMLFRRRKNTRRKPSRKHRARASRRRAPFPASRSSASR